MARLLKLIVLVMKGPIVAVKTARIIVVLSALLLTIALGACRGEPVPRDYQNAPPAVTHPIDKEADSPTTHGGGQAPPQPSTGVEGRNPTNEPITPPVQPTTTTMPDTPPVTTTT
jgi:hypothetical protein